MDNTVFGGIDWASDDLLDYQDTNDITKVPGYKEASEAFRAAGVRLPTPWDWR